jgi:hypothetical protein
VHENGPYNGPYLKDGEMKSILTDSNKTSNRYWATLDPPGRQYYCTLQLVAMMLRGRETDPELLRFIETEVVEIKKQWGGSMNIKPEDVVR